LATPFLEGEQRAINAVAFGLGLSRGTRIDPNGGVKVGRNGKNLWKERNEKKLSLSLSLLTVQVEDDGVPVGDVADLLLLRRGRPSLGLLLLGARPSSSLSSMTRGGEDRRRCSAAPAAAQRAARRPLAVAVAAVEHEGRARAAVPGEVGGGLQVHDAAREVGAGVGDAWKYLREEEGREGKVKGGEAR